MQRPSVCEAKCALRGIRKISAHFKIIDACIIISYPLGWMCRYETNGKSEESGCVNFFVAAVVYQVSRFCEVETKGVAIVEGGEPNGVRQVCYCERDSKWRLALDSEVLSDKESERTILWALAADSTYAWQTPVIFSDQASSSFALPARHRMNSYHQNCSLLKNRKEQAL